MVQHPTLINCTTCCQNTSNSCTFSGTPLNLLIDSVPSFSLPLIGVDGVGGSLSPTTVAAVAGVSGTSPQALLSAVGLEICPFCKVSLALAFWTLTFSANRLAAASSCLFVSSGSSLSASRAAYAASRSMRAMTICLMFTFG